MFERVSSFQGVGQKKLKFNPNKEAKVVSPRVWLLGKFCLSGAKFKQILYKDHQPCVGGGRVNGGETSQYDYRDGGD